jgi:hypothetical protein
MIDIMHDTSVEIFEAKKKALQEGDEAVLKQAGGGKDIMSILSKWGSSSVVAILIGLCFTVKANMEANEADKLSEAEVLGQVSLRLEVQLTINAKLVE